MSNDVFRSLTAGAHFDRKKFKQDVELFEGSRAVGGGGLVSTPVSTASLDFFKAFAPKTAKSDKDGSLSATGSQVKKGTKGTTVHSKKGKGPRTATRSKGKAGSHNDSDDSDDSNDDDDDDDDDDSENASSSSSQPNHNGASGSGGNGDDDDDDDDDLPASLWSSDEEGQESARGNNKNGGTTKDERRAAREVALLRKALRVNVKGRAAPAPLDGFAQLVSRYNIPKYMAANLESMGYATPTPIQAQVIPALIESRDVLAIAPTGSGKTAAYLIPIFVNLKESQKGSPRAVIIAPTRELAMQIYREATSLTQGRKFKIAVLTKATGAGMKGGTTAVDVLISTPMRVVMMLQEKQLDLSRVSTLVLDEADRLFELGFVEQVDEVFAAVASSGTTVQYLLCSATMPSHIEELAMSVMRDALRVSVGARDAAVESIEQKLVFVGTEEGKILAMRQLLEEGLKPPILVFVQSKIRARELFQELIYDGINVEAIHADRTKTQRDNIVKQFRAGRIWVLICTDLMARGVDFKGVNCVINFDFPQSVVSYIHRIGRTGRAGRKGKAVTFFTESDGEFLRSIANVMELSGCAVPKWMLELKPIGSSARKRLNLKPPKRFTLAPTAAFDKRGEKPVSLRQKKKKNKGKGKDTSSKEAPPQSDEGASSGGPSAGAVSDRRDRKRKASSKSDDGGSAAALSERPPQSRSGSATSEGSVRGPLKKKARRGATDGSTAPKWAWGSKKDSKPSSQ